MKIVDINVLIYAINQDAPLHGKMKNWWERAIVEGDTIGLCWIVILGFIRIVTSSRIMPNPLSSEAAIELVNEWLSLSAVEIIHPRDSHWIILKELFGEMGTAANLTTDAHLAALAIDYGAQLYSTDNDFSRYKKLRWVDPAQQGDEDQPSD